MNQDVAELVRQARNDDLPVDRQHAAFAELMLRFEESAFRWSMLRLGDPAEAQDAAQEAFITAWLKLRQLRDPAAFGAWLKRLVATQCNRRTRISRSREQRFEEERATTQTCVEHGERQRLLA